LDLIPADANSQPSLARTEDAYFAVDRGQVEEFLLEQGLQPFLQDVQKQRQKELDTIARHVEMSLLTLIDRQQRQAAELLQRQEQGEDVNLALSEAERRLDELNARLERRRQEIQQERQLAIADLVHIGSALVLPHPEREDFAPMVRDEEVERIAMEEATRYERERGWIPEDVSSENRGFDILSRHPASGGVRFIEVKGRATTGPIVLTRNEYKTAERLRNDYWLYVVFDCAIQPRLLPIPDPVRLGWQPIMRIDYYQIQAIELAKESSEEASK
jgi:hypothetical protein